jgi:hypothetical protein
MRRVTRLFAVVSLCWSGLAAQAAEPPLPVATLADLAKQVDPARLQTTIETLVGFGTRHTLSSTTDEKRGIGAARKWVREQFGAISKECGDCLTLMSPVEMASGNRLPQPAEIVNVLAVQQGTSDAKRVVIISGHIDSRNTDVMDGEHDAPGANDDGSGVAAVIEAATVLSKQKFAATIVYAVLTGEEQGLYGGKLLAKTAKEQGWEVEAVLNNDIIGNIEGQNGVIDKDHYRLFSEGTRAVDGDKEAGQRRLFGGEVDSPSRNLARLVAEVAGASLPGFEPKLIYRADRMGRGGDQLPMQEAGYPAIRITEAAENYTRQHQNVRVENGISFGDVVAGVNFPYLAQTTRVNVVALADLAWAPAPPAGVKIAGAVNTDTTLTWTASPGAAAYLARWRASDLPAWKYLRAVEGGTEVTLKDVVVDDWIFGVAAVSAQGFESPVSFAGSR